MENLVPLGTGNSRLMKSNIPASTTLAQLIQMWNNGTFPYDIGPLNSTGISQQGTPLNKATLLKDATAALYGLPNTAVPDDVLAKLANAAFVENGGLTDVGGNSVGIQIATGSYVGTGTYGESNPTEIYCDFPPKFVVIVTPNDETFGVFPNPLPVFPYDNNHDISIIWESNKISLSNAGAAVYQFNGSTYTYYYAIIG